jgi:hypothetical protein
MAGITIDFVLSTDYGTYYDMLMEDIRKPGFNKFMPRGGVLSRAHLAFGEKEARIHAISDLQMELPRFNDALNPVTGKQTPIL